jgi:3-hydroxyisobutyrate dehydrogenase and related beta-hydroxyacid dehydrogenases
MSLRVCLLGFGEVGQALAVDLGARGVSDLMAWDILFPVPDSAPSRAIGAKGLRPGANVADAIATADLVISAVTAAQDVVAARSVAPHLKRNAYLLDVNSVSPAVKVEASQIVEAAGGRYVEAAIMSPINPQRAASPMLFGGPHAAEFLPIARQLGFSGASVFSDRVGSASAAKMCRSVIVKGMEALLGESLLAARRYGVEDAVLESLGSLLAKDDWHAQARYMISRSLIHGRRRAEEMREVARTIVEAGFEPRMSSACAVWQDWAAAHRAAAAHEDLNDMLDSMTEGRSRGSI